MRSLLLRKNLRRQPLGLVPVLISGLPERLSRIVVQTCNHCLSTRHFQFKIRRYVDVFFDGAFRLADAARIVQGRVARGGIVKLLGPGEDPADGGEDVGAV